MKGLEPAPCPSCGSGTGALQGRLRDGQPVKEWVCIGCRYVWPADLPTVPVEP